MELDLNRGRDPPGKSVSAPIREAITILKGQTAGSLASLQYFEEYAKVDGAWRLAKMRNDYLYWENVELLNR